MDTQKNKTEFNHDNASNEKYKSPFEPQMSKVEVKWKTLIGMVE